MIHQTLNNPATGQLLEKLLNSPWYTTFLLKAIRNEQHIIIDFQWLWGNNQTEKLFHAPAMGSGEKFSEILPVMNGHTNPIAWYAEVTESGKPMEKEHMYSFNGTSQWYRERITRFEDGVLVMSENITEQKNNQIELQRKNNLLQGVLDSTWSGVGVFKAIRNEKNRIVDFLFIMLNRAARQMYARHLADFDPEKGKIFSHVFPGGLKPNSNIERYARVVETGEPFQLEFFYPHDGLNDWIRESGIKYEDGLVVSTEIVTSQRNKAEELKRSQKLLLESQEIASIGAFEWDEQTDEIYWTPQLYKIAEIENQESKITLEEIYKRIHPEDKATYEQTVKHSRNKQAAYTIEYRIVPRKGKIKHIWERGRYHKGKITGAAMDITERKELELGMKKLASRNTELDTFVYTASHDLRSPVHNMEILLSLLDQQITDRPEVIETYIRHLKKCIYSLKSTLHDLTQVTEIHPEKTELINLTEIVDEVKSGLREQINEAGASVNVRMHTPFLSIPRRHARSLVYNMLSNAVKFRAHNRPLTVDITCFLKDERIHITFADNGLGIKEENLPKVFQIFKRFNPEIEGRGIGMYLVKRVIDLNNGDIFIEIEENAGTTFHVHFPVS
jgi:two-component system, chemotaxis family, CheB/CheR fusion protein